MARERSRPSAQPAAVPQKVMVPSDPSNSPFSDRHARSEHGMQGSRDVALLLPVTALGRLRISAPEPICSFYLLEAFASEQPLARPQRLPSFEGHRGEVNAPDLSLRRNSELFCQPVRPLAPILDRALHAVGACSPPRPVAVFQAQNSQTSIQLPLPFRTFILPDRSAQSVARSDKLTFVPGPLSLRSPKASISLIN
jgi:hypothetical protein